MDLVIDRMVSPADGRLEVVERKGRGHPDTLCDAIAEAVSRALSRHALERFGIVLHHNVDKVLLSAGTAHVEPGGGEIVDPIEITLAGRATARWKGETIPVDELALEACRAVLTDTLPELDVDRCVRIRSRIRPGSSDLSDLFAQGGANDSSFGVGFAPLTSLERTVQDVGRALEDGSAKELGPDVKVLGIRRAGRIDLVISGAFVARHLDDVPSYVDAKDRARRRALAVAREVTDLDVMAVINAADDPARGRLFLTASGTSAEAGDDGEVGRGNRASGLITPFRPMTMEATAGKNPITHVGKLYPLVAQEIARALTHEGSLTGASCLLASRIGQPIDEPALVHLGLAAFRDEPLPSQVQAEAIVRAAFDELPSLRSRLVAGEVRLF